MMLTLWDVLNHLGSLEASVTLGTRIHLQASVALRQGIRGPPFLFCQHLRCISIYAKRAVFICSVLLAVWFVKMLVLLVVPFFPDAPCSASDRGVRRSYVNYWGCLQCPDAPDALVNRCGNVVRWSITLLELSAKPLMTFFYVFYRLTPSDFCVLGFHGDRLAL